MSINSNRHQAEAMRTILFSCVGWSGFTVADATAKWLSAYFAVNNILFISSSFITIVLGILIIQQKGIKGFVTPNIKLHLLRGFMVVSLSWLFLTGLSMGIPMPDFYGIVFTTPFFVMIFAKIILNEKIGKHRIIASIFGFIGVLIIAESSFASVNLAYLYVLIGASLVGANTIIVRKIGKSDLHALHVFYPSLMIMVANAYPALSDIKDFYIPDIEQLIFFVIHVGFLFFSRMAFISFTSKSPLASIVAQFQYIQILTGTLLGWYLFREVPTYNAFIGISIIIMAGVYTVYREKRVAVYNL